MTGSPARMPPPRDPVAGVMRYHEQTKHCFDHFAPGPGQLDWANQPAPFRRYEGARLIALPRLRAGDAPASPPYADLFRHGAMESAALTAASLSRFLECSLAITAWKQAGATRWALRANPSSGNLHPTEAYVLLDRVPGLCDAPGTGSDPGPGLYHYAADEHALELRAQWPGEDLGLPGLVPGAFLLGLASVHWREAWKYGERAFRYCQHDLGHALGSTRLAAAMLGWRMQLLDGLDDATLARLLGLDRAGDFEGAEREVPAGLAVVWADDTGSVAREPAVQVPRLNRLGLRDLPPCRWHGKANRLSRNEPLRWPAIEDVQAAAWKPAGEPGTGEPCPDAGQAPVLADAGAAPPDGGPQPPDAASLMRRRRSALAFDGRHAMPAQHFFALLARTLPWAGRALAQRPPPWDAWPWAPAVDLALFVHRVEGLEPGLYMLVRDPVRMASLRRATYKEYAWSVPPNCMAGLPLFLLRQADVRKLAAQLCCGQALAADGAFSLAMIAAFEPSLRRHGAWFYRRLFWEAGLLGQVLYLQAQALGSSATGIGCFFDDPVHQVMGFGDSTFQSLYHFAVGSAVPDPRLTTLPPYGGLARAPASAA